MISALRILVLATIHLLFVLLSYSQEVKFALPLHGIPGKDFWIDYYMDHDTTDGWLDVKCGSKSYDGHKGTDFLLRSFKTMDSGVLVYAMADGIVFKTRDGFFDRQKKWIKGTIDNFVSITHGDYLVYYDHLMKYSLLVKEGDTVKAGQPIAKVGSSGYSCYPHVHVQVYDKQKNVIDPFKGNCQTNNLGLWQTEPPYDTAVYAIDKGFVNYEPNIDSLTERLFPLDTFDRAKDSFIWFWVQMHGLQAGDVAQVEWYNPKNKLSYTQNYKWKYHWWYDYTWVQAYIPHTKGKWAVKYFVNKKFVTDGAFYLK